MEEGYCSGLGEAGEKEKNRVLLKGFRED